MAGPSNALACSAIFAERFVRTRLRSGSAIPLHHRKLVSRSGPDGRRRPNPRMRSETTDRLAPVSHGNGVIMVRRCVERGIITVDGQWPCAWNAGSRGARLLQCNEARSLAALGLTQWASQPDLERRHGNIWSLRVSEFLVPDLGVITSVFKIILFDLILSGDNAVVIGMAARRLSPRSRKRAIVLGGAGAIGLRVFFTGIAALVLDPHRGLPLVGIGGGSLLLWIAYKLLLPQESSDHVTEAETLAEAVRTIILADVVMSLDNILAVGAAAAGHLWLLLFGLALSIPILLVGSNLVARLLGRVPLLVYVGALILVWTAVEMVLEDHLIHEVYAVQMWQILAVAVIAALTVVGLAQRQGQKMVGDAAVSGAEPPAEAAPRWSDPPASAGASSRAGANAQDHESAFPQ